MKRFYQKSYLLIFALQLNLLLCFYSLTAFSQCDATTPSFIVDLSNNPDSVWLETNTSRLDSCCFQEDDDPCITFVVTLPPNVGGLYFSVENPQPSISASQFHINCDSVSYSVQDTVCVAGYTPPYVITYCKPGNDRPDYIIAGIGSGEISPPITVSDACTDTIYGTGFKESTITWTSYPFNQLYQSYLSDTAGQDTVIVSPTGIYPDSLQYIICGELAGLNCSSGSIIKCDTTTVYFVTDFFVAISPQDPTICFGGGPATITANASGGATPYSYLWSTGETTQSIDVGSGNAGLYWVEVKDTLECAAIRDSVVVTEFFSSIAANAGNDLISCLNNPSITLNGSIQAAPGGIWTGGGGNFTPDDSTLNAVYTPDSAEISTGIAVLFLTTTGNGSCPADVDTVQLIISPDPLVFAGIDQAVCANAGVAALTGTVSGGSTSGQWTSSGNGTFSPNDSSLNATYNLSASDISTGTVTLYLASTNNGQCLPVKDSLLISINSAPAADAGTDQSLCKNNSVALMSGSVTGASITGQWTSSGSGTFSPNDSDLAATYIPGIADTAAGNISIILTSTNNGGCNPVSDTLVIIFTEAPTATAGNDLTVCGDSTNVSLNGIISISGGGIWTSTGTGTFSPNDSALSTSYLPSSTDTSAGVLEIILTSTGNGNCSAVSDTLVLTITDVPSVEAGADQTVCANNAGASLNGLVSIASGGIWTTNGSGNFSFDTLLSTSYIPSDSDTTAGIVTIYLTTTGNGSCNAVSDSLQIIITPAPMADAGADIFVCKTNPDAVLNGSVFISTGGNWTSSGSGVFTPATNDLNAAYIGSPADVSNGTVIITLTTTGNVLCSSVSDDVLITYTADSISLNAGNDTTVCSASFPLNGSVSIATGGAWTSSGSGIFSPNDSTLNANYTFSNADTAAGSVTFFLTTTGNGGCASKNDTMVVSLAPSISVNASAADSVCGDGDPVPVSATSSTSSGLWTTLGIGTFVPNDSGLNIAYIPGPFDISSGKATLIFSSANNNGCAPVSDTVVINLVPAPFTDFSFDSICLNNATIFTDSTSSTGTIVSWNWNFGDGNIDSVQNTFHTYLADGTYMVTLITESNFGCIDTMVKSVPVYSLPNADFTTASQCFVDSVFFNDLTTNNNGNIIQWQWDFGDGNGSAIQNPVYLYSSSGTYTISMIATSVFGCIDSISKTIPVQPSPEPDFANTKACVNSTIYFFDSTEISSGSLVSWNWIFGDGNSSANQNPDYIYSAEGIYTVKLIAESDSGCIDSITRQITVFPAPQANFTSTAQCFVDSVFFTDGSTISTGNLSYFWNFGDGNNSNIQNPSHFYSTGGLFDIVLIVVSDSGCTDTLENKISINPSPEAGFSNNTGCLGMNTIFTDTSTISSGNISSWNWNFGDGTTGTAQNSLHIYPAEGSYSVELIITSDSGCSDTIVHQVSVFPAPNASFTSNSQCFIDSVFFTDGSIISSGNLTYTWDFGDGTNSNIQNPSHYYQSAGSYTVVLIIISDSGCADTLTNIISVNPTPFADFGIINTCLGDTISFTDSSIISSGNIVSYSWDFGDGNTSGIKNPPHNYSTADTFNVQLIVVSDMDCRDTIEKPIIIFPVPAAGFSSSTECFVDSVFYKDTSDKSNGSISQWLWNFGDGNNSTLQNPSHFYSSLGNFSVSLVVISASGCSDSISGTIAVAPAPIADFIMSTGTVCINQQILFVDASTISSGSFSRNWDFGDGTTANTTYVNHSFSTSDTFTILLTVTSDLGCIDTFSLDVIAYPSPIAAFVPEGFCINEGTVLRDLSTASPDTVVSWQWYFGDGENGYSQNPVHFYPSTGNYGVSLIASTNHGCKDTLIQMLTVNPTPVAGFIPDNYVVLTGDPINFNNTSTGSNTWNWNFGDSTGTSSAQNAEYIYANGGTFVVTLIAENEFNCSDTTLDSVIVNVPPQVPNGFSPNGDGKNDLLFPMGGPYKQVEFKIFNSWGELIYITENPGEGWNGTRNGVAQPIGVYVFTLFAITEDDKIYNKHGDVTLLR